MNLSLIKIPFGTNFRGKKRKRVTGYTESQKLFVLWAIKNEIGFVVHA